MCVVVVVVSDRGVSLTSVSQLPAAAAAAAAVVLRDLFHRRDSRPRLITLFSEADVEDVPIVDELGALLTIGGVVNTLTYTRTRMV